MKKLGLVLGVILAGALSQHANALTIFSVVEDLVTVPAASLGFQAPTSSTGTIDGPIGSSAGLWRSPWENPDATPINPQFSTLQYTSVRNGTATYNVAASDTLSLFWGSPDTYNTLTFWTGLNGTGSSASITGASMSINTFGHDLVTIVLSGGFFSSVVLSSTSPAFEFANMVASCAQCEGGPNEVPLPGALPLFVAGAGVFGGLITWRKKRKTAAA